MGLLATWTGAVKHPVGSIARSPFSENHLLAACALVEKEKGEWQVVEKTKGTLQTAGPLFPEAPTGKDKNTLVLLPVTRAMSLPDTRRKLGKKKN